MRKFKQKSVQLGQQTSVAAFMSALLNVHHMNERKQKKTISLAQKI